MQNGDIERIGFQAAGACTSIAHLFAVLDAKGLYSLQEAIEYFESWQKLTSTLPNPNASAHFDSIVEALRMLHKQKTAGKPTLHVVPDRGPSSGK